MGTTPTIYDVARIERLLKSMNSKLETIESIMIDNEEEIRAERNEGEEDG